MGRSRRELTEGARLDRYELLHKLGEGGMAAVWLARLSGKRGFAQLVALKTIKAHLGYDLRFEQMFLDEARIASGIRHPNVAQILDLGEEDGILYLVMEWVEGESLSHTRQLVEKRNKKIPLAIALRIIADAAAGLHAAHELKDDTGVSLGVIHRDVSPQNILVSTSGVVKVIDFGIAKARNRAAAETTDGLLKGKVAYMSPEQAKGLPIDRRADVWALGVCLYELLTGRLPFEGDSQQEILRGLILLGKAPPLPAGIPEIVCGLIDQALAPDAEQRFLTASAFERALEGVLTTLGPTTSDDVATFLREACPDASLSRKELLANVERATGPVTRDLTPPPEREQTASLDVAPAAETRSKAAAPPPSRARGLMLGLVGAGLLGGIVYAGLSLGASAQVPPVAPSTPAANAASSVVATASAAPALVASATIAPAAPASLPASASAPAASRAQPARPAIGAAPPRVRPAAQPAGSKAPAVRYDSDGIPIGVDKKP